MTRILHTADLHLAGDHPERWDALDAVLRAARDLEAEALVVAGDLLDSGADHAALRPRVRGAFEAADMPIFLLPGNHDRSAYRPGQDWGPRTTLLLSEPVQEVKVGSLRLVAVPFPAREIGFGQLRREVEERLGAPEGRGESETVLILHGTLIDRAAPEIQDDSRSDEAGPYFPIRSEDLGRLPVQYVALGHYHQHALRRIAGVPVAYAGSPAPVGSHAWGPRSAILVDLEPGGAEIEPVRLPVAWRARRERWLTPFEERAGLEALAAELEEAADPLCHMRVRLDGILADMTELELREAVERLRERLGGSFAALDIELEGVGLDRARADLFRDFSRRLDERLEAEGASGDPRTEAVARRALELAARALKL
jgi:DNA repair exonuclease SbcCD nuclease subunit